MTASSFNVAKSHALDAADIEVDRSNHPEHGTPANAPTAPTD
jgi:hypothetical protein